MAHGFEESQRRRRFWVNAHGYPMLTSADELRAAGWTEAAIAAAQGIAARSDETPQEVQPERQEPGPEGMRPTPGFHQPIGEG